jgi:isohexenylglutaconyl-CoA hydratase
MIDALTQLETVDVRFDDMVAYVTLNRPEVRNAMNIKMVAELTEVFTSLKGHRDVRVIVLQGTGGFFCAGGDIKEMRDNPVPAEDSAHNLDVMLRACDTASQVVIARVEGGAIGGGFGLVCVSDIALTSDDTTFGLSEVRLGVAPAFISPFVLRRIGLSRTRELMLTGRRFKGQEAREYHLVHESRPSGELDRLLESKLDELRQCAPGAIAAIKELIFEVFDKPLDETVAYRANLLNQLRSGTEAQEGLLAFSEKRSPNWVTGGKTTS